MAKPAGRASTPRVDPWLGVGIAVLLVGLFGQLQIIRASYALGGHEWSQGDWLINFAAGPIRRGVFGEGLLRLSDWSGVSPLALVVALQASLAVALFLGTALLLLKQSRPWMVLAIVNPGIFAIVWIVDPISGGRKELFALLALLLVALPGGRPRAPHDFGRVDRDRRPGA